MSVFRVINVSVKYLYWDRLFQHMDLENLIGRELVVGSLVTILGVGALVGCGRDDAQTHGVPGQSSGQNGSLDSSASNAEWLERLAGTEYAPEIDFFRKASEKSGVSDLFIVEENPHKPEEPEIYLNLSDPRRTVDLLFTFSEFYQTASSKKEKQFFSGLILDMTAYNNMSGYFYGTANRIQRGGVVPPYISGSYTIVDVQTGDQTTELGGGRIEVTPAALVRVQVTYSGDPYMTGEVKERESELGIYLKEGESGDARGYLIERISERPITEK
jgi:hypothetical protein